MECRRCKASDRRISQAKGQSRKYTLVYFLFYVGYFCGLSVSGSHFYF